MSFTLNGMDVHNFNDVATAVSTGYGFGHAAMADLRDLTGHKRLGDHVRTSISSSLQEVGIGHLPSELPNNQSEEVRLYTRGSRIGKIVAAVLHPTYEGDTLLQDLVADSSDAEGKLKRIRSILNGLDV
ncbi:hypothetical protein ACFQZ2_01250 [Streptomonospora algeriensis]|uniref:HK97 gp10 family phage protein n=1 Tax=Streptomonospora algeriensis TaxID=995084 RepID=A0ABW3BC53_9ACTN